MMVNIEKQNNINIITFTINRINALVSDEIRDSIVKVFRAPNARVIIDLSGVKYIDSSGFGCFLSVMKTARSNYGSMRLANPEPSIMELFRTLHLHTVFQIYDDLESCIASFN